MRRVYPGFVQLSAFMSMNLERHVKAFRRPVPAPGRRRAREGRRHRALFYDEYFAVIDLPAEFYLETVRAGVPGLRAGTRRADVCAAARVEPAAIRRTALFTVEGERDDICAIGQTVAAHDLCPASGPYLKHAPRAGRRRPLRRVQRPALAERDLPDRARHDLPDGGARPHESGGGAFGSKRSAAALSARR